MCISSKENVVVISFTIVFVDIGGGLDFLGKTSDVKGYEKKTFVRAFLPKRINFVIIITEKQLVLAPWRIVNTESRKGHMLF